MKKAILFIAIISPLVVNAATITSTVSGGDFSLGSTWVGGVVPSASDDVVIADGATVTIDEDNTSYTVLSLWIEDGATVNFILSTSVTVDFSITNNLVVELGGAFNSTSNTGTKNLNISGDLVVDGVFDFDHTNAVTYFLSSADNVLRGTGSTCNFQKIVIDKSTGTLEVTRTFTVVTPFAGTNIEMTSGTFKISSATTIAPNGTLISTDINTSSSNDAEIWLNHSSAILNDPNANNISFGLHLHVTAGTVNLGGGGLVIFTNGTKGKLTIDGPTAEVNISGRVYFLDDNSVGAVLNMSDGEFNVDPGTSASGITFRMDAETELNLTGGTITLVNPVNQTGGQDNPAEDFVLSGLGSTTKDFSGVTLSFGDGVASTSGNMLKAGFSIDLPTGQDYEFGSLVMNSPLSTFRGVKFINTHDITVTDLEMNAVGHLFNTNSSDITIKHMLTATAGALFADTLTFFADANGYSQLAIGANGSVSSNGAVFMQYISRTTGGWVHIGFPVQATMADLDLGNTPKNYSGHIGENMFYYDASTSAWVAVPNASHAFDGRGFAIYMGGVAFGTLPKTISVHGSLISGNRNISLSYNNTGSTKNDGWNLVSNPYPSNLDWESVKGNLTGNTNNSLALWNGSQYATYLSSGVNTNGGRRYIAPMQAFFVNVSSGGNGDVLPFTNSHRVTDSTASVMRTAPVEQVKLRVFEAGSTTSDEIVVYFDANATDDYDASYDAVKLKSQEEAVPNLYSIAGTSELSINALTNFDVNRVVELGFESTKAGQYTIHMIAGLANQGWDVYLYDKEAEEFNDIANADYTFKHSSNNNTNRFSLHFSKQTEPNNNENVDFVSIISTANLMLFNFDKSVEGTANIEFINLMGQVVYENIIEINAENVLDISNFAKGQLLLVRVTHENKVFTQKLIR